jgi:uncharacterized protein involved in outer membrane biogenesis
MTRIIKFTFILLLAVVTLLVGFTLTLDLNRYKDDIVQLVESRTGRKVSIEGKIHLGISLIPTVVIEHASLGNVSWGARKAMLTVRRFEAGIDLLPLLDGEVRINHFALLQPELYLETDRHGRGNWIITPASVSRKKPAMKQSVVAPPSFDVNHILLQDATVSYRNGRTGIVRSLKVPRLSLAMKGVDAPGRLKLGAEYKKIPVRLRGTIGPLNDLLQNRPYSLDLKGQLDGVAISLAGRVQRPLEAEGIKTSLRLGMHSLSSLSGLIQIPMPHAGPVSVTASLTDVPAQRGVYQLQPLTVRLNGNTINGTARLHLNGRRLVVNATLASRRLDLRPFQSRHSSKERLFSSKPLPRGLLWKLEADLAFKAREVVTHHLSLQDLKLGLQLHGGRLHLSPLTARVADGYLKGQVWARGSSRSRTVDIYTALSIKGLKPGLLPKFKGKIRGGSTHITLSASGRGGSVAAIMAGLHGDFLARVGKGKVHRRSLESSGGDLLMRTLSLLSPEKNKDAMSDLRCGVIAFHADKGLARSDKGIAMETTGVNAVGGGTVNLATEELDLGLRPYPRRGLGVGVGRLAEMVRLGGTLSDPHPKANTLAAVRTAVTVGAAVFTGGISLLAGGLYNLATTDNNPCATALAFAKEAKSEKRR